MHCVNDVHRRRGGLRSPVATRGRGYHTDGRPGEANEEKQVLHPPSSFEFH